MENKTMYQQLLELGMQEDQLGNWCSDLYVLKNDISTKFINEYEFKCNVKTFKSNIDGLMWYDVPFAYSEYHEKKTRCK